jgi:hypothetical protein
VALEEGAPAVNELWRWLEETAVAEALRSTSWGYPVTESVHLIGIALLVGPAVVFDLRLLGVGRSHIPLATAATVLLRVAVGGAVLAVWAGFLLFITDAQEMASNPAFLVKIGLILLAAVNALVFRLRSPHDDGRRQRPYALISIGAWLGAIVGGRFIAYV